MDKENLLKKLKKLQQWQMQQHLHFASNHSNKIIQNQLSNSSETIHESCFNHLITKKEESVSKFYPENSAANFGYKNNEEFRYKNQSDNRNDPSISEHFFMALNSTSTPSKHIACTPDISSGKIGSDSEDSFSHFNIIDADFKIDGVEPINNKNNSGNSHFNRDKNDNTVIKQVLKVQNPEDIPLKVGDKGQGYIFEELLDRELKKVPFIEKPPPVKAKFSFLKCGDGIKRFQKGSALNSSKNMGFKIKNQQKHDAFNTNVKKVVPTVEVPLKFKKKQDSPKELTNTEVEEPFNDLQDKSFFLNNTDLNKNKMTSELSLNDLAFIKACSEDIHFMQIISNPKSLNDQDKVLEKELLAFEELEEAAENLSLSSNCSVVQRLLGKRVHHSPKNEVASSVSEIQPSLEFVDQKSWSDASETSEESYNETLIDDVSVESALQTMPRRFVCKHKENRNGLKKVQQLKHTTSVETEPNTQNISDIVKLKIKTLDKEIAKFRAENEKMTKLRQEREIDLNTLRKQLSDFEKEKVEETNRFEQYKISEIKKLKTERKMFESYQKMNRDVPSKIEREEIKELQEQISQLNEDLKIREERWNAAANRFRGKISQLEEENNSLRKQVTILEQERLLRSKIKKKEKIVTFVQNSNYEQQDSSNINGKCFNCEIDKSIDEIESISCTPTQEFGRACLLKSWKTYEIQYINPSPKKRTEKSTYNEAFISSDQCLPSIKSNHRTDQGKHIDHIDGKVESVMANGSRLIKFANGTEKVISADERTISVTFFNGDVKRILPDNRMVYYYAQSQTTHTTFSNGLEVLEFPNKQIERRFPDGRTEIIFPDQTVKKILANGCEETIFGDGTIQKTGNNGETIIAFPNGQRETHTPRYKKREYPNGTVKTIYEDGRQETKYSNGRLRVKDKLGNLLIDTGEID